MAVIVESSRNIIEENKRGVDILNKKVGRITKELENMNFEYMTLKIKFIDKNGKCKMDYLFALNRITNGEFWW